MILNGELEFLIPEGFEVMDEEERKKLQTPYGAPAAGLRNPDKHMMITLASKQAGGFAARLLDDKDVAKKMEASVSKAMKPYGYSLDGFIQRSVGGKPGSGFRYSYAAEGTEMTGEFLTARSGKTFYYLYLYARSEMIRESLQIWEGLLDSARWAYR